MLQGVCSREADLAEGLAQFFGGLRPGAEGDVAGAGRPRLDAYDDRRRSR